jgi:putative ATP-dependent endonuclease of OLD family
VKLRRLDIKNYRGKRDLSWIVDARFACLVGPGDSTKTTILDALGCVLSPRYNLTFTDADFYGCDTSKPIEITAAVVELPDKLIRQSSQGMNLSGIHADGSIEHDPTPEVEACVLVRVIVDQGLEPVWEVIRPGDEQGQRITAAERGLLGFFRIGDFADAHLRWGRGSALTGVTTSKVDAVNAVVEAQRQARRVVAELSDTPLHEAATLAQVEAIRLGSAPYVDLRPGLDPRVGTGSAALVLHEGDVPLTNYGLGSRRLTSLAIQDLALEGRSIVAIDEVEHGLDPHRLLHLIRYLRNRAQLDDLQVFLTTTHHCRSSLLQPTSCTWCGRATDTQR